MSDTVRPSISIDIQQSDDDLDTGLTVEQWNALTDAERSKIYRNAWNAMAEQDNGGVTVVTEGAESV